MRHIRLPDGSGEQDLLDWARTAAMGGFDSARPLWEFTLVEGLDGDRAALVMKAHHVVTDGIGAVQLAAHLFDFELEPPVQEPTMPSPVRHLGSVDMLRDVVAHDVGWNYYTPRWSPATSCPPWCPTCCTPFATRRMRPVKQSRRCVRSVASWRPPRHRRAR